MNISDFPPNSLSSITSGNNQGIVSQSKQEDRLESFYADRERVYSVQSLVQGIIQEARSHQCFVNSLGRFRGENSSENQKLKRIQNEKPPHITPKIMIEPIIQDVSLKAIEAIFLINKGFLQVNKAVPENIQLDLARLDRALADLTKRM